MHEVVKAIYKTYTDRRGSPHRNHLGASQIGHHCDRYLWYQFHWADHDDFDGRMLRLFDHGNLEEDRLVNDLRNAGVKVLPVDPDTGRQWNFAMFGDHFGCSIDAVGKTDTWFMLEFKTASDKRFKELVKLQSVKEWSYQYYAQAIIGMELSGLTECLHITINKNTDEIYAETIYPDKGEAETLIKRAERVIFSPSPLERCHESPSWWQCKFCCMKDICHGDKVAEVNDRTHANAEPLRSGGWADVDTDNHLMNPYLVPYAEAVEHVDGVIKYDGPSGVFWNNPEGVKGGRYHYTSEEMRVYDGRLPLPDDAEDMRVAFDGSLS